MCQNLHANTADGDVNLKRNNDITSDGAPVRDDQGRARSDPVDDSVDGSDLTEELKRRLPVN
jgi:hypothetical protein